MGSRKENKSDLWVGREGRINSPRKGQCQYQKGEWSQKGTQKGFAFRRRESSESGDDSFLDEIYNNLLSGSFSGYGLYPLSEIIGCCENPAKTIARVILEFAIKSSPIAEKGQG